MRKIKKFKIQLRPREIVRALRTVPALPPLPADMDERVERFLERYQTTLLPAAVYETCPPDQLLPELVPALLPGTVAVSTLIATIGEGVPVEGAVDQGLWAVCRQHATEQAVNFIARLLAEEAAHEGCELSERQAIVPHTMPGLLQRLGGERIGVRWEEGRLVPGDSQAVLIPWFPLNPPPRPKVKRRQKRSW